MKRNTNQDSSLIPQDFPKSYYNGLADMTEHKTIGTLKGLSSWFNRNGTPSEGVFPEDLPKHIKAVQVLNNAPFHNAYEGDMIIISDKEPNKYIYFEEDDYGAGYACVGTDNYTADDYKEW